ncbi:MAG TPA: hypothetical protein VHL31_06890, partial [Geminicoccus sp.]|nr:hypothetical protein [Geminicoccus sp.]
QAACNIARQLKALRRRTPIEAITAVWQQSPSFFTSHPASTPRDQTARRRWPAQGLAAAAPAGRQGYHLSNRDLEEALAWRLSFRRCCGLGLEDAVPGAVIDHETGHSISRGSTAKPLIGHEAAKGRSLASGSMAEAGLVEAVFDALNTRLEQRGLVTEVGFDALPLASS